MFSIFLSIYIQTHFHIYALWQISIFFAPLGNNGCGVWVMSSSLPQLLGNYITHNRMYGLALFCRKDPEPGAGGEGGVDRGADRDGERGGVGGENLNEEGELSAWENDLDSEDERFSARRPISVALVESNCMSHNGGH